MKKLKSLTKSLLLSKNLMNKTKNLTKVILLGLISLNNAYAKNPAQTVMDQIKNDMRETRIKEGFKPSGGVSIVSSSKIHVSEALKLDWERGNLERKENGYVSIYSNRAKELLNLNNTVKYKYAASLISKDKKSSIFRKDIKEISMGYKFKIIPNKHLLKVYGFAASNTYKKGWSGAVEFFKSKKVGNCAFTENNVALTHQSAKVDDAILRYDINSKVTVVNIEGNPTSGYLYIIDWFDDNFFRTLECSNTKYSKNILNETIELARNIDIR